MTMRSSRFSKLILAFVLFLFTITITGVHAWAPVLLENIEHQHELSIIVEDDASSHWSLQHSDDSLKVLLIMMQKHIRGRILMSRSIIIQ